MKEMKSFFLLSYLVILISEAASSLKKPRIIGGYEAYAGDFPYVAAIHVTTATSRFFGGGALLNNQWILTAAQCVDNAITFTIQLGSIRLNEDDSTRVTVATSEYFIHPNYNRLTLDSDIGLIRLRAPIRFSDYIQPIYNLPTYELPDGWQVLSAGWGQISNDDAELAEIMKWAPLGSLTNQECKITYGNAVTDNMVCAVGNYNEGLCIGDTGTPLTFVIKWANPVPYGIASFVSANGCESPDPSGYTRVYPFVDWIVNITGFTPPN